MHSRISPRGRRVNLFYFAVTLFPGVLHHLPACIIYRSRCHLPGSREFADSRGRELCVARLTDAWLNSTLVHFRDARFILPSPDIGFGDAFINQAGRYNRLEYGRGVVSSQLCVVVDVVAVIVVVGCSRVSFPKFISLANSFGNKYLLSYNGEICTATDDMIFVLPRSPRESAQTRGAEGRGRGKERDCIWKL